jgi:lipoprotein-anchoring transpeptidase ErfK/SrfK
MAVVKWLVRTTVAVALALPSPSHAQWPSWADDVFSDRPGWRDRGRFDPPPRVEATPQLKRAEGLSEGGARPQIQPLAPEIVNFPHDFPVSSIVIDTSARKLFYVLPESRAYAYSISVGREGFNWTGTETVSRKQDWPDWHPPAEMRQRDPRLPEKMTGGIRNPLGAMALYLGSTLYRIHGTNDVKSIGQAQSSGCFRMTNAQVLHLASLVEIGTPVSVVAALPKDAVVGDVQARPANPQSTQQPPSPPSGGPVFGYRDLREQTLGGR